MKYLVSEIQGGQLDAAVAMAEGMKFVLVQHLPDKPGPYRCVLFHGLTDFAPSSDWSHGGPIIERERIALQFYGQHWGAVPHDTAGFEVPDLDERKHTQMGNGWCPVMADGETALVATMRAFVRMRLGDEVDL